MQVSRQVPRLVFGADGQGPRTLPEEVAVALTFNGTTQAVMMATPSDLVDFAYGFAMTEGIAQPGDAISIRRFVGFISISTMRRPASPEEVNVFPPSTDL